jgi:hypothetical protein
MPAEAAKLIIEVTAGIVPGTVMPEHTRRFALTSAEYHTEDKLAQERAWDRIHGEAIMYASRLMNPNYLNWVRLDWIWV